MKGFDAALPITIVYNKFVFQPSKMEIVVVQKSHGPILRDILTADNQSVGH